MKILSRVALVIFFLFLFSPVKSVLALNSPLLIVEVQIDGGKNKTDNDFIKIYNLGDNNLDISGYRLRKKSSTGKEYSLIVIGSTPKNFRNTIIPAKGYFLWANSKDDFHLTVEADVWSAQTLAKNNSIALSNPEGVILDALSWGESQNPFIEGSPFPENPGANQQLKRKGVDGNYQNTNNNNQDFFLYPPSEPSQPKTETILKEEPRPESATEHASDPAADTEQSLQEPARQLAPPATEPKPTPETKEPDPVRIDINSASIKGLQKITGVGPVLGQRMIEARPFYSLDELTKVSGIGPKTLEDIKKQGLAWVDPELEPPKIEKTESIETGLAAVAEPFKQGYLNKGVPKSLFVFLIALLLATFSGIIILFLKKRLKIS